LLVVQGEAGEQRKRRPLDELRLGARPLGDLVPRVRRAVEQVKAKGVADTPVVEVARPAVHLRRGDLPGLVDEGGEHPRLIPAGLAEGQRQLVVPADPFGELLQGGDRDTERLLRHEAVPGHTLPAGTTALPFEELQYLADGHFAPWPFCSPSRR